MKIKTLDGLKIKITKSAYITNISVERQHDDGLFIDVSFKETTMRLRINKKQYNKLLSYEKERR